MSDNKNKSFDNNIEDEEIEDDLNNNMVENEYEEDIGNQINEEEGQEFTVAFDMQINNNSFILLVGETDENKLILRLVEKDDDTKPFFQNEFSLEELKEISSLFKNFNKQNEAIDYIIKNLTENEKEMEIIDDNSIKLSLLINEEKSEDNIDFILHKVAYILEGEEEQQIKEQDNNQENNRINMNIQKEKENGFELEDEGIIEEEMDKIKNGEGVDETGIENGENYNGITIEEENLEYSEDIEKSEKKNISIDKKRIGNNINNDNISNENIPLKTEQINNYNKNDNNTFQTIIEDANENNILSSESKMPKSIKNIKKEIRNETNETNDVKESNLSLEKDSIFKDSKMSMVIEELKENLDSLGGAMNLIEEQNEKNREKNYCENIDNNKNEDFSLFKVEIMKNITSFSDNFNNQIKQQKDYFIKKQKEIKEENNNIINEMKNEINKKNNELNDVKKILNEKISNLEKILNLVNEELKNIKNNDNNINNNLIEEKNEKINSKKDNNNNISSLNNYDIEKIKNDFNSKMKEIEQKIISVENEFNTNNKNNNLNININEFLDKLKNIENKIMQNDQINDKIKNIENKINTINNINNIDKDKKIIFEKINNIEN